MEYLKSLVFFEDYWFFYTLVPVILGNVLPSAIYKMTKEKLENKHGGLGYMLWKGTISYRKAYYDALYYTIDSPLFFSIFIFGGFASSENKHGLEALILCLLFTIPPTLKSIKDTLKRLEKEAKEQYSD